MNEEIKKIIDEIRDNTQDWSYYESHCFENNITEEGEYVTLEDFVDALYTLAEKLKQHYENKT